MAIQRNSRIRSLLSEADMEDTGTGLLSASPRQVVQPAVNPLAEQIRALYGTRGDWNQGGIDRAAELADLLSKAGVTDVSKIALQKGTRQELQEFYEENTGPVTRMMETPANRVLFGDKALGFAGDYGNDNTYGMNASDYLQEGNVLGWSARGKGNVKYRVGTDAQGNNYLTPEWGSSSDMGDVRDAFKAAAVMAALAYGVPMLGGEAAAAGAIGGAESAAFADMAAGLIPEFGTAAAYNAAIAPAVAAPSLLSSAPMTTTLGAPAAELVAPSALSGGGMSAGGLLTGTGAPAVLSEAAVSALPSVAPAQAAAEAFRPSQNYGEGMTGAQTSAYDSVINATGSPALANAAANAAGTGSAAMDWLKTNPTLAKLLFSGAGALLNTAGGGGGGGTGYVDSGYRPTISRGGFNASPQARQMQTSPVGLLSLPTTGQPMSGLLRFGPFGG